jgi:hypothetical protein
MRILITNLLAVAVLLFGATSASAFAFNMSVREGSSVTSLAVSDTVTVDIFMDADPGLQILGLGVLAGAPLGYDIVASENLPIIYPAPKEAYGTTGAAPGYVLYTAGMPATSVYPLQNPAQTWPNPPAGATQVNVNFAEGAINPAVASGSNIWIASLVFHVDEPFESALIGLTLEAGGNVLRVNDVELDPAGVALSKPIKISGLPVVPEPTTAVLIGLGVLGLAVAGRRK